MDELCVLYHFYDRGHMHLEVRCASVGVWESLVLDRCRKWFREQGTNCSIKSKYSVYHAPNLAFPDRSVLMYPLLARIN